MLRPWLEDKYGLVEMTIKAMNQEWPIQQGGDAFAAPRNKQEIEAVGEGLPSKAEALAEILQRSIRPKHGLRANVPCESPT